MCRTIHLTLRRRRRVRLVFRGAKIKLAKRRRREIVCQKVTEVNAGGKGWSRGWNAAGVFGLTDSAEVINKTFISQVVRRFGFRLEPEFHKKTSVFRSGSTRCKFKCFKIEKKSNEAARRCRPPVRTFLRDGHGDNIIKPLLERMEPRHDPSIILSPGCFLPGTWRSTHAERVGAEDGAGGGGQPC